MKIVALPALVLFAMSPSVSAGEVADPTTPATVEALTQALGHHYKTVKTLQADVTQTSRTAMGETVMTGRMVVERPAKARWELQGSGYETLMVFDGAAGWLYTPASKQVIKMAGSGANAMDPIELVRTLDERFQTRLVPDAPADRFVVEGTPNAGTQLAAQYKLIRLELEKGTYLPLVLMLTDNYGGSTEIAFAKSVFNETVAASLFTFEPPAGVTVVDGSL